MMPENPTYEELVKRIQELEQKEAQRRLSEAVLKENERKYRILAENSDDVIWTLNAELTHYTYISPSVKKLGYTPEEFLSKPFDAYIVPKYRDYIKSAVSDRLQREKDGKGDNNARRWELEFLGKNRKTIYVESITRPLRGERGVFQGLLGVTRDITERKEAERQSAQYFKELAVLRDLGLSVNASLSFSEVSSVALRGIMDALRPDMAFLFLREGNDLILQEVLPSEARLTLGGIPEHKVGECICGLTVSEGKPLFSRDIHHDLRCTWDECKRAGITSFASLPMKKGEETIGVIGLASFTDRDFEAQAGFLETMAHQISLALANARLYESVQHELTERKKAEESLALERTFIDAIFNSIPGMLYLYDAEGGLIRWNRKHELMTGYSPEELANMHLLDWYKGDPASQKAVLEGVETTLRTGFGEAEAHLRKKDGSTLPMYFTASLLTINGKQYFTGIGIDITEKKRAEAEREKLQAQLVEAQKMESVGRLAGGISHDFNNMLGVILGRTELALKLSELNRPLLAHLQEIDEAARRSADLTRQLLAFARKQTVAPQNLDLTETVGGMLKMLQRLIGEDIDLVWRPGGAVGVISMDPAQIDQILVNLCVNARDAIADTGKIIIETGSAVLDREHCLPNPDFVPGQYVLLVVSDDGCGMDKDTQAHLFEPFFTTKETGKGTGLGLATVYGIVKQNGGFVHVYSEPGQGSTFRIYLPQKTGGPAQATSGVSTAAEAGGNETILLVEDEPMILDITSTMLEQQGYKVLAAATPGEAVRLAAEHAGEIHLLMTDVVMPEMNGRDLALNLLSLYPKLRRLFMSGYTANVIAHHGVLDEGVHFIQKPFSLDDLGRKVREAMG